MFILKKFLLPPQRLKFIEKSIAHCLHLNRDLLLFIISVFHFKKLLLFLLCPFDFDISNLKRG